MKKLLALAVLGALTIALPPAFAADAAKAAAPAAAPAATPAAVPPAGMMAAQPATNSQQDKMKMCQAKAGEKKLEGKDRQAFVNECLKAKPESKIAMCNKKTAGMKGEERNKAQSECMKAPA